MRRIHESIKPIAIYLSITVAIVSCTFLLGYKNFSMDELDTVFIIKDWSTLLHIIFHFEGNMWLYYILLHFWEIFGYSETPIRFLSVLFAIGTIPFTYLLGKELFNTKVARIATLLLSLHVFLIYNAQNARGYTMELFFTTLSSYLFTTYILQRSKKHLFSAAIVNALAVYSHMYAVFVIGAQFLSLFLTRQKKLVKETLLAFSLTGILLLPLALAPSMHSGQINWIAKPDIKNLIGTFLILADDFPPIAALYIGLFTLSFVTLWKKGYSWKNSTENWKYGFVSLWILFPVLASFFFSIFVKPIYISSYLFVCLVPFTLFVAFCLQTIQKNWLRNSLIVLIVILSFIRLFGWYTNSKTIGLVIRNYNEDWKGSARFLTIHEKSSDAVLFLPPSGEDKINFYVDQQKYHALSNEVTLEPTHIIAGSASYKLDHNKLSALPSHYAHVWYVLETVTDKRIDENNLIITRTLSRNYALKSVTKLEAITIYEYER